MTVPNLFDLQVNGFAGVDFQQPDVTLAELETAARGLLAHGASRILPTLITDRVDSLCAKLERFERFRGQSPLLAEMFAGYHLEGPYLLPEPGFQGAHNPGFMKAPEIAEFDRLQEAAGGRVRLVTLAPEWPGSPGFIRHATQRGVRVAIGHSNANDFQIGEAIAAGMTLCTHLGNGAPALLHRHDNIIQRLLARDELTAVFIPDGIHLPPPVLRNFVRAKPRERVLFTTDCMAAAGAPPGRYRIAHVAVEVGEDRVVREPGKENFAGSSLAMDEGVANIQKFLGWSEEEARAAFSTSVATALGMDC